jgi:sugar lactone lactonase YvrE
MNLAAVMTFLMWAQERPWTVQYPEEAAAMNRACTTKDFAECRIHLLRLKELLDGRGDIVYRLAKVEANLGNRPAALEWFSIYSKMGLQLADPMKEPAFASFKDDAGFEALLARLKTASAPVTESRLFATLLEKDLIPEDIVYDEPRGRFFVSSVRHRKILSLTMDGKAANFVPEGDWPILALAADSSRRILWATTVALPEGLDHKAADEGKSALLKFNLDSGKLLKRYDLPAGEKHELGDMTLSAAGDVYASDGLGSVFAVDHARDRIETLFGPGTFNSPQTPALSPDGRRLFVPDYSRGISIVDLATRESRLLEHQPDLSLGGIDGLYLAGRTMIAIQNGTAPERLIRMQLDEALTKVLSWETIEANWKGLGDPTHGVRVGDRFYFIANSGWDVKPGGTFDSATIRVMDWQKK